LDTTTVALVLVSAALHAAWNAAARNTPDPATGLGAIVITAGVLALVLMPFTGLPALASVPWLVVSVLLYVVAMRFLLAAYARTSFAIAYPTVRGVYPPIVLMIAIGLFGELPGAYGIGGIALVSTAMLLLALASRGGGAVALRGLGYALLSACVIAFCIICDAAGARASGAPLAYACASSALNAVVFGGMLVLEGKRPFGYIRARPGYVVFWAVASMISYMLVLYAYSIAPAALVSALRETSVLFATIYAAFLLKERLGPLHWLASLVATAGVVLIRLG